MMASTPKTRMDSQDSRDMQIETPLPSKEDCLPMAPMKPPTKRKSTRNNSDLKEKQTNYPSTLDINTGDLKTPHNPPVLFFQASCKRVRRKSVLLLQNSLVQAPASGDDLGVLSLRLGCSREIQPVTSDFSDVCMDLSLEFDSEGSSGEEGGE